MNEKLKGVIPALMTAFDDNGVDKAKVKTLVNRLEKSGVHGLYVGGSSGEMVFCSEKEREDVLEAVMEEKKDLSVIAHIGALTTADSVKLSKHAKKAGADAVSSVTPLYYKYSFRELKYYYERIAEAAELPVIIYSIPALSGTTLSFDQIAELLNIRGVEGLKFTMSDFYLLNRLKTAFPDKLIYNGSDEMLLSGLSAGADGGIGTNYNYMPEIFLSIYDNFKKGDYSKAYSAQTTANQIIDYILKYGILPSVKHLIGLSGIDYGICREPLLPLEESAKLDLENAYKLVKEFSN